MCASVFLSGDAMIGDERYCPPPAADPAAPPPAPGAPAPVVQTITVTREQFLSLPIAPAGLERQPVRDWVLINIETIAYAHPQTQTFDIDVLGTPVTVRAEPVSFTWDFGEGEPFTTTSAGHPYPDHDVFYEYKIPTEGGETRAITLTTSWEGAYSVAGGQWQLIEGQATTTETTAPFVVQEARTALTNGQ